MADKKISALTGASTPLAGTEVLPIVQSGTTVKVSAADVTAGRAVSGASFAVTGSTAPANGVYLPAANTVAIAANSKDFVYVSSGGLVRVGDYGAGNPAPGYALTINNKDNYSVAAFLTGATYRGSLGYTFDTGYLGLEAAGRLAFHSNSVYAGEFDTAGNFKAATGNVVIGTAGKGIDFSANANAPGMTSELLNDYEEGTFTATLTGSSTAPTTPVTATAYYTKIGRLVTCHILFSSVNTTGASGAILISGLPFTPALIRSVGACNMGGMGAVAAVSIVSSGNTTMEIWDATQVNNILISAGTGKTVNTTISYLV